MTRLLTLVDTTTATLGELLLRREDQQADRVGLRFLDAAGEVAETVTYGAFGRRCRQAATVLTELGARSERVLIMAPPGRDYLEWFGGCLLAGAVAVPAVAPTNSHHTRRLRALVDDAGVRFAVTGARSRAGAGDLPGVVRIGAQDHMTAEPLDIPWCADPDDVAFLQYTSGSTSRPRGVVLTHRNLLANLAQIASALELSTDSSAVVWLPPYHDMGLIGGVLTPLYRGFPTAIMAPRHFAARPLVWLEAVSRLAATVSGGPNSAYELCVEPLRTLDPRTAALDLSGWSTAFVGAEPVRAETLRRFAEAAAPFGFAADALRPCYGLAEATLMVSCAGRRGRLPVAGAGTGGRALVSCGAPVPGTEVAVVDPETGRRRAPGEVGEIWVAGPGVASGYWGHDEEASAVFGARVPGDIRRFLRTGDLGLLDPGGHLVPTGRIKELMIVRGRNLYPHDVEDLVAEVLRPHRVGAAAAFDPDGGGLAVLVEVDAPDAQLPDLLAHARAMITADTGVDPVVVAVRRGTIPRTSSGKIQRGRARELFAAGRLAVRAEAADRVDGSVWRQQAERLRRALGEVEPALRPGMLLDHLVARVQAAGHRLHAGTEVLLGELGLDSLALQEIAAELTAIVGAEVSSANLLDASTLSALSRDVARLWSAPSPPEPAGRPPAEPVGWRPATAGPSAMWTLESAYPGSGNVWFAAEVTGRLEPADLRAALGALVARHDALRTVYRYRDPAIECRVVPAAETAPEIEHVSAGRLDDAEVRAALLAAATRPFDLATAPAARVLHLDRGTDRHIVVLVVPHLAVDFGSMTVLAAELTAALSGTRTGIEPVPYHEYTEALHSYLDSPHATRARAHFRELLTGVDSTVDMIGRHAGLPAPGPAEEIFFTLGEHVLRRLTALAATERGTLFSVLLALYHAALHGHTYSSAHVVGVPMAARLRPRFAHTVGPSMNPVPVVSRHGAGTTLRDLVRQVRGQLLAAAEHQAYPLLRIAEDAGARRTRGAAAVYETAFVYHQPPASDLPRLGGFDLLDGVSLTTGRHVWRSIRLPRRFDTLPLTLTGAEHGGTLAFTLRFLPGVFDRAEVAALARTFRRYAEELPDAADAPLPVGPDRAGGIFGPKWTNQPTPEAGAPATERIVTEIFREVLGAQQVAPDDDLFTLDAQSLQAVQIAARLAVTTGREVTARHLFDGLTVRELARYLDTAPPTTELARRAQPTDPATAPVSSGQHRLWFRHEVSGEDGSMAIPAIVELTGRVDPGLLRRGFDHLVGRHETLRAVFAEGGDGAPVQVPGPTPAMTVHRMAPGTGAPHDAARERVRELAGQPWSLRAGPLVRCEAWVVDENRVLVLLVLHHTIVDGWSGQVLLTEFAAVYRALAEGEPPKLPPMRVGEFAAAAALREAGRGDRVRTRVEELAARLADAQPLRLPPAGGPPDDVPSRKLVTRLGRPARRGPATVFATAAAAFLAALKNRTGCSDLVVGIDVANRDRVELEPLVGYFGNQVPMRVDLAGVTDFDTTLSRVRAALHDAIDHAAAPYEDVVAAVRRLRPSSGPDLFDVKIVHQHRPADLTAAGGDLRIELVETGWASASDPLALWVVNQGDRTVLEIHYRTDRCPAALAAALLDDVVGTVRAGDRTDVKGDAMASTVDADLPDFSDVAPRALGVPSEAQVQVDDGAPSRVARVEATGEHRSAAGWLAANRATWRAALTEHGALVLTGFAVSTPEELVAATDILFTSGYQTTEHPREVVAGRVVTPVSYPAELDLLWHNEDSFNTCWPGILSFACATPPGTGGETTVVDGAQTWRGLSQRTRDAFAERDVCYVRRFVPGLGLPWTEVFRTGSRAEVDRACRLDGVRTEWDGDSLTTYARRPAVLPAPSGGLAWFAQILHWHEHCLAADTRAELHELLDGRLPRECTFGDSGPIPDGIVDELIEVSRGLEYAHRWRTGDLLIVDNRRAAHGRRAYTGERRILVAFGDPVRSTP